MRVVLLVVLVGCASESRGGGGSFNEPKDWYAGTAMVGPITFDSTTTELTATLEASLVLTSTQRYSTSEITGLTVIGEITEIGTGARLDLAVAIEGEEPGMYGTDRIAGPYTHGHGDATVLDPLAACFQPPCTATERYTVRIATMQNPGSVQVQWRAILHVILADTQGDDIHPPIEEEGEALSVRVVEMPR